MDYRGCPGSALYGIISQHVLTECSKGLECCLFAVSPHVPQVLYECEASSDLHELLQWGHLYIPNSLPSIRLFPSYDKIQL